MAQTFRAQVSVWHDTLLPRDAMVVNPCFKDNGLTFANDPQSLCDSIANYFSGFVAVNTQVTAKLYELPGGATNHPKATKTVKTGLVLASTVCRELAITLSFYAGENVPRKRGRLYIPLQWLATKTVDVRPSAAQQDLVKEMGNGLSALGGADIDWGVWSDRDQTFRKATNTWTDDEWDVVRSRGLRAVNRRTATVSG